MMIIIGNPKSDGEYVVYGFSAGFFQEGLYYRNANVLSAVRLPLVPGEENQIIWKMKAPVKQRIHFYIADKEVYVTELLKPEKWTDVTFAVTPKESKMQLVEIKLRCENFVLRDRRESCFSLSKIVLQTKTENMFKQSNLRSLSLDEKIFFGDIHIHSHFSWCGGKRNGSPEENLSYARDVKGFDFAAITDHAEHLTPDDNWEPLCDIIEKYNKKSQFVTIPAYEWTSDLYGHRNVYLAKPYKQIFNCMDPISSSPEKLWVSLRESNQEAITIPHHSIRAEFPMRWEHNDSWFQPVVEICSMWGSSEYFGNSLQEKRYSVTGTSVQDALAKGLRLGFVGGSDGHERVPGTGGITAVFAKKLSRNSILEAIRHRHCYATTGPKIKLHFIMNNRLIMGDEIVVNQYQFEALYPLLFYIAVEGTAPIEKIELLECNQCIASYHSCAVGSRIYSSLWNSSDFLKVDHRADEQIALEIPVFHWQRYYSEGPRDRLNIDPRLPNHTKFYYVRITQQDGHMAWSSPIWIICKVGECERTSV
ncbi:MAG: DUF3604 domain-containing protein [Thermoproteales archaeon]|nr:DUF3604 domain-containing protein [Thermoproteales archaeon]